MSTIISQTIFNLAIVYIVLFWCILYDIISWLIAQTLINKQ